MFIDGTWVDGSDTVAVLDPATGVPITEVAVAGAEECAAAVDAAAAALPAWSARAPRERAEVLRRAFRLMVDESDRLAELVVRENGKVLADARAEIGYAAEFFRWFSEEAVRVTGEYRVAPGGDKRIIVTHQPVGVSLLITPWNFPAAMATRKIGPALAAGCAMVLKPATETPLTALAIADILHRAGLPGGVLNVVVATPSAVRVREMLHDPRVAALSFTGSTEVGRLLLREAADQVVRPSMELGGNAPFIVLSDADVSTAAAGALTAKLRNGGAACTAANRFYVHRSVARDFVDAFSRAMAAQTLGPGMNPASTVGSLVSVTERDKVAAIVTQAVGAGARATAGGAVPDGPGAFYPPTVLAGVAADDEILDVEIFGPVAPVVIVEDDDEAVYRANNTPYGLISYVYGEDQRRALRVAERLESGMVGINRALLSDPAAPFGGFKQSGLGREGGFAGIHEFLETKYIATDL
ncbi:NAD-dependent succinate-semialdehyde dehydrogenase [Dactylosporangium sp. NPDC005572]|uniref:NAD-dependent succinate-semialdehyde dehydrogenase n=1 Tax=Dactylosporangium sp. NPDC005572 TaxID=3156889 RepID=UPI0033BEAA80